MTQEMIAKGNSITWLIRLLDKLDLVPEEDNNHKYYQFTLGHISEFLKRMHDSKK